MAVGGGLTARWLYAAPAPPPRVTAPPAGGPEPGPYVVELGPGAAGHPDSATVLRLLQVYFSSINNKQYDQWTTVVSAAVAHQLPPDAWQNIYASTMDGSIQVDGIDSVGDALQILLSYTSVQDLAHAPPQLQAPCARWRVVYRVVRDSGSLRLDTTVPPGNVTLDRCS